MTQQNIRLDRGNGVLTITIDRAAARNAFDLQTAQEMEAALDLLDASDDLHVGIITGAGGFFSAGQDLKAAARGEPAVTEKRGGFGIMKQPAIKPLIAAIEGPALAGGFELALCCDLIVASRTSVFGLPEVQRSLVALGGALFRLPRRIPYQAAMEMILTGAPRPAADLEALGFVNRVSEPGGALEEAMALARALCRNGPLALQVSKEIASRAVSESWTEPQAWPEQMRLAGKVLGSEDFREGLKAFAEKRDPVWRGR
jgi:enoyl-CoA hydratase